MRVERVVDGDTVWLEGLSVGRRVGDGFRSARLIGIDTPELDGASACLGRLAADAARESLQDERVLVAFDVDRVDRYGRALVYLWTGSGDLLNAALARRGYAAQLTVPPNVRYARLFGDLVREAREARRGLWGDVCAGSGTMSP